MKWLTHLVSGVTRHVVREHQDDIGIWDSEALDGAVHREGVGHVLLLVRSFVRQLIGLFVGLSMELQCKNPAGEETKTSAA
jgi:hypothetical protein